MPKMHTFPTLYNDCKSIEIAFLKKHGYLEPDRCKSGTVTWSRNGTKTGSISILVNTLAEQPYIELDYKCNDKPIKYKAYLVSLPSNIGKGGVWYFLCPNTGKRCRKLYLADTYFLHREAFKGCLYEKQTYSKQARSQMKQWEKYFGSDKAYEQLYSKYFKTHYKGKPTKRYIKLMKNIKEAGEVSENDIINALIKR